MENLPQGQPDPFPPVRGDRSEAVNLQAAASVAARERVPWRSAIAGTASLGAPAAIGMLDSLLGEIIATTEVTMAITVIAVTLFGSKTLSERAFRLLRWFGNRAEPPAPS